MRIAACTWWVIGVSLLVGCADEQSAERRAVGERLAEVMKLITKAEQGYVPEGSETEVRHQVEGADIVQKTADLGAFRQQVLSEAAEELESMRDTGSTAQQISTRRVLANIYASQARDRLRKAMSRWVALADRSASLMSDLGAVGRADWRVRLFDTDESLLLSELQKDRVDTERQIQAFKKEVDERRRRAADLAEQISKLNDESELTAQQAQRLHAQALVATDSPKQYDLYDQSANVDRRANVASAAAGQLGVTLDVIQSELAEWVTRDRLAQQAIKTLNQQIAAAQQRQASRLHEQAVAAKSKTVQEMAADFGQIADEYVRTVEADMDRTAEKMNDAIDQLATIIAASPQDNSLLQMEQLGHMADMTHVLADHILVAGCHGHTLAEISQQASRLMPSQAKAFEDQAQRVYTKQRKLIETTKQIISDATAICDQLSHGRPEAEDFVADFAQQVAARLEAYRVRIDQHRLSPHQG